MPPRKPKPVSHRTAADSTKAVDEFMRRLDHPFRTEIEAIRTSILGTDRAITEGIKWNAPSSRTREYFATTNRREKKGIGLILHLGAKVRDLPAGGITIDDPLKLLRWLGKGRATIAFEGLGDIDAKRVAFQRIIQQWIVHV
jgi:hypothetical protein